MLPAVIGCSGSSDRPSVSTGQNPLKGDSKEGHGRYASVFSHAAQSNKNRNTILKYQKKKKKSTKRSKILKTQQLF